MIGKHLSEEVQSILELAREFGRQYGHNHVGTEHLLLALLGESESVGAKALAELSVDQDHAKAVIDELLKSRSQETWIMGRLPGTPNFRDVLARAGEQAKGEGNWQVRSEHLLLALLAEHGSTGSKALDQLGVTLDSVRRAIAHQRAK